ncbi:MAG: ABC transporter substrate-binding protein [Lachnospiraceae bacterium]|nr:ABC transporter substrate-binding protein [Lachnospiraceae bacterium]
MKKKLMAMVLTLGMVFGTLTGCAQTAAPAASSEEPAQTFKVGIVSFMEHASLNQIQENVQAELDRLGEERGVTFDYENYTFNGQGDSTIISQSLAQLKDDAVDAVVCIATPTALTAQSVFEGTETPIIFSAVTDPVGAGLAESFEAPGMNITGTSDALNTEAIMNLIFAQDPEADKIGLLYSTSEDSSTQAIADAKAFLDEKGVEYVEKTGTNTDEVSMAADALIGEEVDAVFTPTDNTVMNAELAIYEKLMNAGIPHYAGADSFALNGAFLGFGINYADLGVETAKIVADILEGGQEAASYPVVTLENGIATVNTETTEALGFDLDAVKEAFDPFCSEIVEITTAESFE